MFAALFTFDRCCFAAGHLSPALVCPAAAVEPLFHILQLRGDFSGSGGRIPASKTPQQPQKTVQTVYNSLLNVDL